MNVIVDDKIPYIRGQIEQLADEVRYLPGSNISSEDVHDVNVLIVRTRTRCDRSLLDMIISTPLIVTWQESGGPTARDVMPIPYAAMSIMRWKLLND